MIHFQRTTPVFSLGLTLLLCAVPVALSACNTEDIRPHQVAIESTQTDPAQGWLLVLFSPTDLTFAGEQARAPLPADYHLFIDGQEAVLPNEPYAPYTVVFGEGGAFNGGYLSPGMHHFEIAADGARAVFSGDGPIVGGEYNRLYLFGPLDALQSRFVSFPFTPPAGNEHVSAINLIRAGGSIEVLGCDAASHCTPVSPPLALGDTFDADFPTAPSDVGSPATSGGYPYRMVPTASVPDPPLLSALQAVLEHGTYPAPLNYIAAPIYVSPDGHVLVMDN